MTYYSWDPYDRYVDDGDEQRDELEREGYYDDFYPVGWYAGDYDGRFDYDPDRERDIREDR